MSGRRFNQLGAETGGARASKSRHIVKDAAYYETKKRLEVAEARATPLVERMYTHFNSGKFHDESRRAHGVERENHPRDRESAGRADVVAAADLGGKRQQYSLPSTRRSDRGRLDQLASVAQTGASSLAPLLAEEGLVERDGEGYRLTAVGLSRRGLESRPAVGTKVQLTGYFLKATGQEASGEGAKCWSVRACDCEFCLGRFVCTDEEVPGESRYLHIALGNLEIVGALSKATDLSDQVDRHENGFERARVSP